MFCIKCGKPAKKDNFCKECFLESHTLFDVSDMTIATCGLCGVNEKEIGERIEKSIKSDNAILKKKITMQIVGNRVYATITCDGKIKGISKSEAKKILVLLRKKMCDMHVKLSGGYYEAMIQIRGENKDLILKHLQRAVPKKAVNIIETVKEGYNVKMIRKSNAVAAVKMLRGEFSVKSSYKLVGSKKGRMLYRNFYAVR